MRCYKFFFILMAVVANACPALGGPTAPDAAAQDGFYYESALAALKSKTKKDPVITLKQATRSNRVKSVLPYGQDNLVIISDHQERTPDEIYIAEGNVDLTYHDMRLRADRVTYNALTQDAQAFGNCVFNQGAQYFYTTHVDYNFKTQEGRFYDVSGFTDKEFLIKAHEIEKKSKDRYDVKGGFLTACREATPFWSFTSTRSNITANKRAILKNAVFRIKDIPLLYFPLLVVPLEKRERQTGFLMPSFGSSTSKGTFLHGAMYLTLGPSADAVLLGDYFSKRGSGYGVRFRARPYEGTRINVSSYLVNDRLGAGGGDLFINAETPLKYGFRAVADINYISSFRFRQTFSDSFHAATNTFENSSLFITKNFDAFSTRFFFSRQVTFFPDRPVIISKGPAFDFVSLGKRIGSIGSYPFYFYMDSSIEDLSRLDRLNSTDLKRLDFYPRISVPVYTFGGISLTPTFGVRQTYYSNSLMEGNAAQTSGKDLNRYYYYFELAANGPGLYKIYNDKSGRGKLKHSIRPEITYRRISGIKQFDRIIRFDDRDVIADTNEIEYALVNRLYVKKIREEGAGVESFELLSFKLSQKYFFDPTFGGTLVPGRVNYILPTSTLSAFPFFSDGRRHTSPINTQLRLNPSANYSLDLRADYDSNWKKWRDASVNSSFRVRKLFLSGTYLVTNAIRSEPTTFKSNQLQSQIGYGDPTKGFAAGLILSYDIARSILLYSGGRIHYHTNCCGTTIEFRQFNLGFRSETQFRFSFMLKGLGHFGNLRRPESLF